MPYPVGLGPHALIPGITKDRFNVNVAIEANDMLFHFRSDSLVNLSAVALWLQGSNNLDGKGGPWPSTMASNSPAG